jgi:uncharacterized membrane protein
MVVAFFAISLYSGIASYANLQMNNAGDAGIVTQAVASTAHGHAAPFYESYDCMVKSRCSFLLVHPGFVLYVAVPFYDLYPSTLTLFALRAAAVAAAAIPLYWLTRQVTGSPGKGLLAAGLFLVWAPSFVGDAFSLHLESLLPLELFTLAALWQAGRYRLGLVAALVAFLTFEIFPLFTFLVGAFFLFPYFERPVRERWRRWRDKAVPRRSIRESFTSLMRGTRDTLRVREVRYSLLLMVASVAAYLTLALFMNVFGYQLLGVTAPTVPPGITGVFTNPSSPAGESLSTILFSPQTVLTAEYWLILYTLLAFIPLLSPRALILSLPWIGWTFLTDSDRFSTIGHQYSLIAAGPIFIGLAYGLCRVNLGRFAKHAPVAVPEGTPAPPPGSTRRRWRRPSPRTVWAGVLGVAVVANCLLLPITPALPALGVELNAPFETNYFDHTLGMNSSARALMALVGTIPDLATIAVPSALYALVANHPHAYDLVAASKLDTANLPFNLSGGPQYVLVYSGSERTLTNGLGDNVSNPLLYGVRGYVGYTGLGPVLLYDRGYSATPELFGPEIPQLSATYLPGQGLAAGSKGVESSNSSSPTGKVISSDLGSSRTGEVWTGPNAFLVPGNYSVELQVSMNGTNFTSNPNVRALRIEVGGFGGVAVTENFTAGQFVPGGWTNLTLNVSASAPVLNFDVAGYLEDDRFSVSVASVRVWPDAGSD